MVYQRIFAQRASLNSIVISAGDTNWESGLKQGKQVFCATQQPVESDLFCVDIQMLSFDSL